jgi:hypothetical protein
MCLQHQEQNYGDDPIVAMRPCTTDESLVENGD